MNEYKQNKLWDEYKKFWKNYAHASGTATRREWCAAWLFNFLFSLALIITIVGPALFMLACIIPGICLNIRRLHDTGRSGWCLLLLLIPLVGAVILIVFLCQSSKANMDYDSSALRRVRQGEILPVYVGQTAEEFLRNADAYIKMGDYSEAAEQLNLATRANPSDWHVWFGMMRLSTKNFTDASHSARESYRKYLTKAQAVVGENDLIELQKLCEDYEEQIVLALEIEEQQRQARLKARQELEKEKRAARIKRIKTAKRVLIVGCIAIVLTLAIGLPITLTPGLKYKEHGNGYIVVGTKGIKQSEISIPSTYKGKPIVGIGESAFYDNSKLITITIPNSVTSIDDFAFDGCRNLAEIVLPSNLNNIGEYVFRNCSSLKSIIVPNGVTKIGSGAFGGCSGLTSITLPFVGESQTATEHKALFGYIFGTSIYSGGSQTKQYTQTSYVSYSKLETTFYIPTALKTVIINGGAIGYGAFLGCNNLTNIIIPNTTINVAERAFENCSSLTSIALPNGAKTIGASAFLGCSSLTSIVLPPSITIIGKNAFASSSFLTKIFAGVSDYSAWLSISDNTGLSSVDRLNRFFYSEEYKEPELEFWEGDGVGMTRCGGYWRYVDSTPTLWK